MRKIKVRRKFNVKEKEFSKGDKVEFLSCSTNTWIKGKITRVQSIKFYDGIAENGTTFCMFLAKDIKELKK